MDKKKKGLVLTVLAIISLIAITVGVTYAFFNYTKEGTTENTITTGTITFLYTETSEVGRGIMLENAYPISDSQGKSLTGEGNVFDFKITSSNTLDATIPYEITARKKSDSTLPDEAVRIYLTKVNGTEEEVLLDNYNNLPQTDKVQQTTHIEKTLYKGKVPAKAGDYNQEYRLRMWVDEDIDFSPDENNNYPYNNKTFTITVNVYANAKVVTDEEIENASKAEISSLSVDGIELTAVTGQDYDYETTLPEGTTSTTIDIETISEYATVEVERLDSLVYSSNIKKLSTKKTLDLAPGDNYFKITVTSENKEVENEFKLKISVKKLILDSSDSLTVGTAVTAIDGTKWHVLEGSPSGTETVVLFSDYNLNSDGSYNTECGRDINSTYTCSPMFFDTDGENSYDENDVDNIGYFVKNTYAPLVIKSLPGTTNVTLPTAYQIAEANSLVFNHSIIFDLSNTSWTTTTDYWTKTSLNSGSNYIWHINGKELYLSWTINVSVSNIPYGARPVITTPKTNLLSE